MALLQIEDFDNARDDLAFISDVAVSINNQETSRLVKITDTRIGRLKKNGYTPAVAGAAWASSISFDNYRQYLVYLGDVYVAQEDIALPVITAAAPDANFKKLDSIFIENNEESINNYNIDSLYKFTDLVFKNPAEMQALTNLNGDIVSASLGSALKIADNIGDFTSYVVIDFVSIQPGDITVLLANGLYAKELTYSRNPDTGNPLRFLDSDNDLMQDRLPEFKYLGFGINPGSNSSKSTIGQNGLTYYFKTGAVTSITVFNTLINSTYDIPLSPTNTLNSQSVLGSDGRLYIPPQDTTDGFVVALDTKTNEVEEIAVIHSGATKTYNFTKGILSDNGIIYFFPQNSSTGQMGILKVDTLLGTAVFIDTATIYATGTFGNGCVGPNGKIYLAPRSASQFIEFNPTGDVITTFGATTTTDLVKFNSCHVGPDGLIYAIPFNEDYIYQIDSLTSTILDNAYIQIPADSLGYPAVTSSEIAGNEKLYLNTDGNDVFTYEIDLISKSIISYNFLDTTSIGAMHSMTLDKYGNMFLFNSSGSVIISNIGIKEEWTLSAYV